MGYVRTQYRTQGVDIIFVLIYSYAASEFDFFSASMCGLRLINRMTAQLKLRLANVKQNPVRTSMQLGDSK